VETILASPGVAINEVESRVIPLKPFKQRPPHDVFPNIADVAGMVSMVVIWARL
jgi:hypothetical protein